MNTKLFVATAILFGLTPLAGAAETEVVSGVITNVNVDRNTVTILNDQTRQRRTYFITENTRLVSRNRPIELRDIKRGMGATVRFAETDTGREIGSVDIPDLATTGDIAPVDTARVEMISGEVTGIRRDAGTITIREDRTRKRRTLNVSDDTRITRRGDVIGIAGVRRGDQLTARFRPSEAGPVLMTAAEPEMEPQMAAEPRPEPQMAAAQPVELPKTASSRFWALFVGIGMLFAAAFLRLIRARPAQ